MTMSYDKLFSEYGMHIIRYELETVHRVQEPPRLEIAQQLSVLESVVPKICERVLKDAFEISETPYFHPGRVFVSHDVMAYLGRTNVLAFLNLYVRGDLWTYTHPCEAPPAYVAHELGRGLSLRLSTNRFGTRTVVCFEAQPHPHIGKNRPAPVATKSDKHLQSTALEAEFIDVNQ